MTMSLAAGAMIDAGAKRWSSKWLNSNAVAPWRRRFKAEKAAEPRPQRA
jgi:hypothetical protein